MTGPTSGAAVTRRAGDGDGGGFGGRRGRAIAGVDGGAVGGGGGGGGRGLVGGGGGVACVCAGGKRPRTWRPAVAPVARRRARDAHRRACAPRSTVSAGDWSSGVLAICAIGDKSRGTQRCERDPCLFEKREREKGGGKGRPARTVDSKRRGILLGLRDEHAGRLGRAHGSSRRGRRSSRSSSSRSGSPGLALEESRDPRLRERAFHNVCDRSGAGPGSRPPASPTFTRTGPLPATRVTIVTSPSARRLSCGGQAPGAFDDASRRARRESSASDDGRVYRIRRPR